MPISRLMRANRQTAHTHTLTNVHAKVDPVVYIICPDRSRKRVEQDRKHSS